jgi:NAD+ kinase
MRSALVMAHTGRGRIVDMAGELVRLLQAEDFEVRMLADEAADLGVTDSVRIVSEDPAMGAEIAFVLGGDGTFLRATEATRPAGVPLIGVNLGHVGFLAEAEPDALASAVAAISQHAYTVEERLTIDVEVEFDGEIIHRDWALNEASVEKSARQRMLEVALSVDGLPLTSFGCDGVLCATPTGSTAYAFSVGGPIVWPNVEALLVVPNAAHALFGRPLVVGPDSIVTMELLRDDHPGVLSCDGRRGGPVPPGGIVTVRRGALPVRIARLHNQPFGARLVAKFQLPVRGFRAGAMGPDGTPLAEADTPLTPHDGGSDEADEVTGAEIRTLDDSQD